MKLIMILISILSAQIAMAWTTPPSESQAQYLSFKNKLINPGFENGTSNWTNSGATFTVTTTAADVGEGLRSGSWDASAASQTLVSSNYTIERGLRATNGLAQCRYRTTATDVLMQVHDGTNVVHQQTLPASSVYALTPVLNFVFPSSGTVRIRYVSQSNSDALFLDDCYLGPAFNIANVAQSTLVASAFKAGTTNCSWSVTSTTFADFSTDTDCPAITVDASSGIGSVVTTDDDLPQIVLNNLPPGNYKVTTTFTGANLVNSNQHFRLSDGTTGRGEQAFTTTVAGGVYVNYSISALYSYAVGGNRTFKLQARQDGSAVTIANDTANLRLQFIVERLPGTPETVASINQGNYGWTQFTPTTQGFGTTTSNECFHARDGEDMLINCKFTTGTVTASEARLTLPGGLTSKSSTFIPSIRVVGQWARGAASASNYGSILIEPGVQHVTFGAVYAAAANPFTKLNGSGVAGNTEILNVTARVPIAEWTNSQPVPVFVGGVSSSQNNAVRVESACFGTTNCNTVCSASPCFVSQDGNWISSITRASAGTYTVNFVSGIWASEPRCVLQNRLGNRLFYGINTHSTSSLSLAVDNSAGSPSDGSFSIICMGPR